MSWTFFESLLTFGAFAGFIGRQLIWFMILRQRNGTRSNMQIEDSTAQEYVYAHILSVEVYWRPVATFSLDIQY